MNEKDNWLPPDNFQEVPSPVVAPRTSPTNIGLSLLANLAAWDFGYLPAKEVIERTEKTLDVMAGMKKFRGHFYNWYDTRSLEPLFPLYISTVDSGNLAGDLLVLSEGLKELIHTPVYSPVIFEGILDTVRVMRDLNKNNTFLKELEKRLADFPLPSNPADAVILLKFIQGDLEKFKLSIHPHETELGRWGNVLTDSCRNHAEDLLFLFPWLEKEYEAFIQAVHETNATEENTGSIKNIFDKTPSLEELVSLSQKLSEKTEKELLILSSSEDPLRKEKINLYTDWLEDFKKSALRAEKRIRELNSLASQSENFAGMDFKFLYDENKKLFTIGYNVMDQRFDAASYDMLASEARLSSYVAIALGQVPVEHWFSLGRLVTLVKGEPVLLSWSGSMFEYLMPLILMPDFEETLMDRTYHGVVLEQIRYGKKFRVPWGISESGYNRTDTQFNYQYQAFGIPRLGLKRGLSKDLVITPYATVLALMVDPEKACENMQRLSAEGHEGHYGFYEAIDYTPSHLPLNEKYVNIFSFMAHHQGMSLLSLVNFIKGNPMQKRFMEYPSMKAFELLLQEKVPHGIAASIITDDSKYEMKGQQPFQTDNVNLNRTYNECTNTPEVNLLSNGKYHLMLNSSGAGYSRWDSLAVTRWRKDVTSDRNGLFIYMRDTNSGKYWSAGFQPVLLPVKNYEAKFTQAYAEFRQRHSGLDITTTVCVSPEDDVELRCIKLTNHTHKTHEIEVTTYTEVVIATLAADEAHMVFSNLFVQTKFNPEIKTLFCTRRPRSEEEKPPHLFHLMVVEEGHGGEISFETDRSRFIGRGNSLSSPLAMQKKGALSGTEGSVLDPVVSLRRSVSIPAGKSIRVCIALGIADTEEKTFELAEKYQNIRMTDRAFELAWTHNQMVLYHLNIPEADAQLFQRLAGSLIYMNPALRANPAILKNNRRGQNGLWGYGISGDVPFIMVRISQASGMDLVKQVVAAHAYWRTKGLVTELLIVNDDLSVYRQPLHDEVITLISIGTEASLLNKAGGIFVRPVDQIPAEDMVLLQSAASIVLNDKQGRLEQQLSRSKLSLPHIPNCKSTILLGKPEQNQLPARDLLFRNGYGGFTPDGKEYVITLLPGQHTPAPWSNVISNQTFGSVISESGSAYTWYENAHEFRLTPWNNDPVRDTSGEAIYIRDEHTGQFWSPTPLPATGHTPYVIRHGFGYTVFEHTENEIVSELWVYVNIHYAVKFSVLKLRNISRRHRRISVTGYCEWVLGDTRSKNLSHVITQTDPKSGTLFARNYYNTEFPGKIAFLDIGRIRTVTGDRKEFIGKDGTMIHPRAMKKKHLSGTTGAGLDPCGAVQKVLELNPAEEKEACLMLGCAQNEEEMNSLVSRYRQFGAPRKALEEVWEYWNRTLGTIYVETPDPSVNVMANGWLLYQTLSCRIWARSGYYQSGGAYGFRDQLQDVMALLHAEPAIIRSQILLAASRQFTKGDVQHWWHPPLGRGVRTHFSDDYLWLPYVTHRYVTGTNDTGILDETIPFIEGRELHPEEESYYDLPIISEETATLYEHCVRSIRYGLKFGVHGLPLMGCGDWNDGMNLVGIKGKGESVWLAFFLYDVLIKFSGIAELYNDPSFSIYCKEQAAGIKENIHKNAWDGEWYRRAYFDSGEPLGSSVNKECKIDTLPQSWSVLSGAGDPERSGKGMEQVNQQLVDRDLKIVRLFKPAFDTFLPSPGYIKGYIPGVRENGGQYTHGAIWTALAFATMGENEKAWEVFDLLNPVNHGSTEEEISIYKVEPYVISADVYSASQHAGRGGWTWYTGSSSWMYRLLVETLLGINRLGDILLLTPRMRKIWNSYTIHYRYYDTFYHIQFLRITDHSTVRLVADGNVLPEKDRITMVNDHTDHTIEMWIKE